MLRAPEVVGGELDQRWGEIGHAQSLEALELNPEEGQRSLESRRFAGSFSQPLAPDGCGSGIAETPSELERPADGLREVRQAEEPPRREPADGDDQLGPEQAQLALAPEGAELLLAAVGVRSPATRSASCPGSSA